MHLVYSVSGDKVVLVVDTEEEMATDMEVVRMTEIYITSISSM